jgi:hypothetical protein
MELQSDRVKVRALELEERNEIRGVGDRGGVKNKSDFRCSKSRTAVLELRDTTETAT